MGGAGDVCKGCLRNIVYKYYLLKLTVLVSTVHCFSLLIFKCNTLIACVCVCTVVG